jgi:hypothetical protein
MTASRLNDIETNSRAGSRIVALFKMSVAQIEYDRNKHRVVEGTGFALRPDQNKMNSGTGTLSDPFVSIPPRLRSSVDGLDYCPANT